MIINIYFIEFNNPSPSPSPTFPAHPQPPVVQGITTLSLSQESTILCNNLRFRPSKAAQSRVIAVDGFDKRATETIVDYLHKSIKTHTNLTVRSFQPLPRTAIDESSWCCFSKSIDQWDMLWKCLIKMLFPFANSPTASRQISNAFCVNIVPFSPLMITLRAKTSMYTTDELQAWRWLASKWWGKI